jgi:hypothetical protein
MSKIQKIAVYDARLQQDEPVYAVQKGALSISVAPFNAIAASSSQMTFQILVPSLNVFVDRKLQLATPLSYQASIFYGGPRGLSHKTVFSASVTTTAGAISLSFTSVTVSNVTATVAIPVGSQILGGSGNFAPGTVTTVVGSAATGTQTVVFYPPAVLGSAVTVFFVAPSVWDVPDPIMSVVSATESSASGCYQTDAFESSGYASAVGPKDLAYCQFPIQSAVTNMTATLNDCTVTTNGDTLREQLMLTSEQKVLKQRTTPTNADTYAWGRDDCLNGSGNFSSYSVVNQYGDLPNGCWPTSWSSDPACSAPLTAVTSVLAAGTGTADQWPFLTAGVAYNFVASGATGMMSGKQGIGFYVQQSQTTVSGVTNSAQIVPFYANQPVWTVGFPGGDILSANGAASGAAALNAPSPYTISGNVLTLQTAVPAMCMVGARIYDALYNNWNTSGKYVVTTAANLSVAGIVSSLTGGALGAPGSTYGITWSKLGAPTGITLWGLSAGCDVRQPLPVYGTINVVEPLVISPLVWADGAEFNTVGLYGMTNMQFVLNFGSQLGTTKALLNALATAANGLTTATGSSLPYWVDDLTQANPNTGNVVRSSNIRTVISDLTYASTSSSSTAGPWSTAKAAAGVMVSAPTIFATFLTPGPDVTLPALSTVPYVEFPRYFYTLNTALNQNGTTAIQSQTISLTSIPDMVMIYVKPSTRGPSQLEQYIPISNVAVTFDNFSNLCSNFQQTNLYECAVAAGLDMDYHQWRGFTQAAANSYAYSTPSGTPGGSYAMTNATQLSGGPILLRMGHDISLQPGLAPGCLGNFSFQVTATIDNTHGYFNYINNCVITIIAINSGFFETVRGQSMIRKTILDGADVQAATPEAGLSKTHLNRMIGGAFSFKGASNLVNRGLAAVKKADSINKSMHLTDLARQHGGQYGAQFADMAEAGLRHGTQLADAMGSGMKRHRPSGL